MVQLIHAIISVAPFQHYITLQAFYRFLFVASVIYVVYLHILCARCKLKLKLKQTAHLDVVGYKIPLKWHEKIDALTERPEMC